MPLFCISKENCFSRLQANLLSPISKTELEKITSVALACIVFLGFQFELPAAFVFEATCLCVTATLLAEKTIRKSSTGASWFETKLVKRETLIKIAKPIIIANIIVGIGLTLLGVAPIQYVMSLLAQKNLRIVAIVLIAPVVEEILFRGFLKERIEDVMNLTNKFVFKIEAGTQKKYSNYLQAIIFGYVHMNNYQKPIHNAILFAVTSLLGLECGMQKDENNGSLVYPILYHECINSVIVTRMLILGH